MAADDYLFNHVNSQLPARRRRLAFLSSSLGGSHTIEKWNMWRGVYEAAQAHGVDLLCVGGEDFENSPQATLYNLIDRSNIDGYIIWNSFFSPRAPKTNVMRFLQRYGSLPFVSIELALQDAPAVLLDNLQGVRNLLEHFIQVHHYRKIGFIYYPLYHSALSRKRAFEQVMKEYGLLDPWLVGTLEDLDRRGMQPGVDYEALIAHSDQEAVGVVNELRGRGVRFPQDVAVAGFNDGYEARSVDPALTTMRIPFRKLGEAAVNLLVENLDARQSSRSVRLPMHLVTRSSCGCFEPLAVNAAAGELPPTGQPLRQAIAAGRSRLLASLASSMGTPVEKLSAEWSRRLFELFAGELLSGGSKSAQEPAAEDFLADFGELLREAIGEGVNVIRWNDAISRIRRFFLPHLKPEDVTLLEDRCHQTRVMISQMGVRTEISRNWHAIHRGDMLRSIIADLQIVFDFTEFTDVLVKGLKQLQFPDLYLILYPEHALRLDEAHLIIAYENGEKVDLPPEGFAFPIQAILPAQFLNSALPQCLLMEALHLGAEQIGYLVIRAQPSTDPIFSDTFEALRIAVSSALKSIQLRRRLQDAVRQSEEANLLKSRFLSMVSHELRTPLNLIVGLSEMAMRQQTKGGRKSLAILSRYLEQIYVSGQHLDRLIRDVLDLASSQVGQMSLVQQPVDLTQVLLDAGAMGKQLADQKNLTFVQEIPQQLPVVWGDKTRLRQVALNLLSNAVKFTARGEIRFKAEVAEGMVRVSVSDTGLGIAREEQETIFDEFHQSTRTMARGYGGIGLGLAITRRLIEMHGGQVWVESAGEEGSGSTFRFTLPVMVETRAQQTTPAPTRAGSILILSDQPEDSDQLRLRLQKHGYEVEVRVMEEIPRMIAALAEAPPGAVVLDLTPTSEQGWELMKGLKEHPATSEVPVLFYSLVTEEGAGTVLELDYMSKPVGVDALVKALKRYGLKGGEREARPVILIIDDDPGILSLHAQIISSELPEAQILTAKDGRLGLELMQKEHPDLVLLDLMMPELDGFGVLKSMQEDERLRQIPVIILTAQVLSQEVMSRLNQGVASVLSKGVFSREEIFQRIESVLSRRQRIGSEVHRLVREAMAYIHEHYKEPLSRGEIAARMCVNEQYLSRCFNKEIGIGPMAYLGRYRIQQAKRLLESGQFSITQVAMDVGFSSQSYFSRIFQQETGQTPSEFMRTRA